MDITYQNIPSTCPTTSSRFTNIMVKWSPTFTNGSISIMWHEVQSHVWGNLTTTSNNATIAVMCDRPYQMYLSHRRFEGEERSKLEHFTPRCDKSASELSNEVLLLMILWLLMLIILGSSAYYFWLTYSRFEFMEEIVNGVRDQEDGIQPETRMQLRCNPRPIPTSDRQDQLADEVIYMEIQQVPMNNFSLD